MVETATGVLRSSAKSIIPDPRITTSDNVFASAAILMLPNLAFPFVNVKLTDSLRNPRKEISKEPDFPLTSRVKLPLKSVTAPLLVPDSTTLAPGSGPPSSVSVTTPVTVP